MNSFDKAVQTSGKSYVIEFQVSMIRGTLKEAEKENPRRDRLFCKGYDFFTEGPMSSVLQRDITVFLVRS
jgi:hypothetical protein